VFTRGVDGYSSLIRLCVGKMSCDTDQGLPTHPYIVHVVGLKIRSQSVYIKVS